MKTAIEDTKTVWIAWSNTDLTEGKGWPLPLAICEVEATAIRMGRGQSVQGSDCYVAEDTIVKVKGRWLMPGFIHYPTKEDMAWQKRLDARNNAIKKAKEAGLTDNDLADLTRGYLNQGGQR